MRNVKVVFITGGIIALIAIIAIVYVVLHKNPQTSSTNTTNQNSNAPQTNGEDPGFTPGVYKDTDNKFTYNFPKNLEPMEIVEMSLPYNPGKVEGYVTGYSHSADAEYCAPSGECVSKTEDFEFRQTVLDTPLATIKTKLGAEAKTETIGNYQVLTLSQGVEGEGMNYFFLTLPNKKTLYFTQKYLDESVNPKYQTVKDFIPLAQQNQMMKNIISSVKFTN